MSKQTGRKKIIYWLLIVFTVIIGGGIGVVLNTVANMQQKLAGFIVEHPQETAVVTYTFDENGTIIEDGKALFHNADEPLIVGSVMKTVVLAAFAEMVVNGELDPNETVSVADWERYYLPTSDGGAHQSGVKSVGLQADELGFAVDQSATVTLDDLATMMMHYSGNASTDYLIERIGLERITAASQTYLSHHTPISYKLGYALATLNHEAPFSSEWLQQVLANVESGDSGDIERLMALYLHDEAWRKAQIEFVTNLSSMEMVGSEVWEYQTAAAQLLPKGTAREYAQMMAQIGSGQFISPQVSAIMQQKLETVPSDWPLRVLYYDRFGAKDGVTAGVLAAASYAVPKRSSLQGQSRVAVLFVNGLPPEQFAQQLQFQGHYLLPIELVQGKGNFANLSSIAANASKYSGDMLFIASECNSFIGEAFQLEQMSLFPQAELAVIADAGHEMFSENPVESMSTVRTFFGQ